MKRTEWEFAFQKLMGDTIWLDDCPDERRLARIERSMGVSLQIIEEQIERIRNLRQLKDNYVTTEKKE